MRVLLGLTLSLPLAHGFENSDLVGVWDSVSRGPIEDGIFAREESRVVYGQNGKFTSAGGAFLFLDEAKARVMAFGGEESGDWSVRDGKLHVKTNRILTDLFSSESYVMTREEWDESIPELLKETDVFGVVSVSKEKIVLKDEADGMETTLTRAIENVADGSEVNKKSGDPTAREDMVDDPLGRKYRRVSKALLDFEGFKPAKSLPTWKNRNGVSQELRPKEEILDRLLCNYAAILWLVVPDESIASKQIQDFLDSNDLREKLTDGEKKILATKRDEAAKEFVDSVGWQMENMWALAWVLGFAETPDIDQDQIGEDTISSIWEFLAPAPREGKAEFLKVLELRPLNEVVQLEDVFYCTHNAVRSAQAGKDTVPKHFHPIRNGGIIHEKRHSLTWVLSPDVSWEDTDLST